MHSFRIWFAGFWIWSVASLCFAGSDEPTYQCQSPTGDSIRVEFKNRTGRVERIPKDSKTGLTWMLSEFLAFEDLPREPIRYGFSLPERGKKIDWGKSFELREQFYRETKPQELRLMLIQEGNILTGWKCFYHGASISIQMLENYSDSNRADSLLVTRAVKGFLREDQLEEDSVRMLIQMVERYALWKSKMEKKQLRSSIGVVFKPVVFLSGGMLSQIEKRLSEEAVEIWKLILSEVAYEKFPPIQRWAFWANLASRNNNEAVRSSVRSFVASPVFKDENMQAFFRSESKGAIQSLSLERFKQIAGTGLNQNEKKFLESIYTVRKK